MASDIRARVDGLLAHLGDAAPKEMHKSVEATDARVDAINDFMAGFPAGPLAAYLDAVETKWAIYVCPDTLIREGHGREDQGSLNILVSEDPSGETLTAIKRLASRLWNGLGQYHGAVAVHRIGEQAKKTATALAAYNVGHSLSRRLDKARSQIKTIAEDYPGLNDATWYVDQAWRQAELMHLMANVTRFGPQGLSGDMRKRFCATTAWRIQAQFNVHVRAAQQYATLIDTDLRPLELETGTAGALRGWAVELPDGRWFDQLYDEALFEIVDNAQKMAFPERLGVRIASEVQERRVVGRVV